LAAGSVKISILVNHGCYFYHILIQSGQLEFVVIVLAHKPVFCGCAI